MTWIKEIIQVPKKLKPAQREALGLDVVDFIRDRTFIGLDKDNKKFKKYSKAYAAKKGVGVDDVNLVLSGEMMDELQFLGHKSGELVIGYEKGAEVNGKAEGNITGSYGKDSPNPKKARNFLGIHAKDLVSIVNIYTGEDE